ncbi:MAG: 6-hydroxymethylpterin diphosphokinase MptE-like protein [Bacillota bacterium]
MTVPIIEFFQAKSGMPTARIIAPSGSSFMLHSTHDPVLEAKRFVAGYPSLSDAGGIICLGLGLGYHLQEILRVVPSGTEILVIENNIQLREWFKKNAKNLPCQRVAIADNEGAAKSYISRMRERIQEKGLVLVEHPASIRLDLEFYENVRRRIRDHVSLLLVDMTTMKSISHVVHANNFDNLPAVTADPGIKALTNAFKDRPAVIVAAGPSLSKNIHLLAEAKNRSVVICVGTAWRAMLAHGLRPDLVVTLDAGEPNYRLFAGLTPTEEFLCYEPQTYDKIIPIFPGRRFAFNSFTSPLTTWLKDLYGDKGYIEPGGSVAIAAFGIACLLGANPIVFIGQDLAYTNGYTHAKGTVYENQKPDLALSDIHYFEVPAVGGGKVLTARNIYSFLVRFEELFAMHKDRLIIDATEGGALKRGTRIMTFRETIDGYFTEEFPVLQVIEELHRKHQPDPAVRERVRRELKKSAGELEKFMPKLAKILVTAAKVQELNDLADKIGREEFQRGSVFACSIIAALKKKGAELNRRLKEANAQSKLIDLLCLLAVDVELKPLLPEKATLREQVERIMYVYSAYLEAAKHTRKQLSGAAERLLSTGDLHGTNALSKLGMG